MWSMRQVVQNVTNRLCKRDGKLACARVLLPLRNACSPLPLQSPLLGFVDDVEFWFPADKPGICEYRCVPRPAPPPTVMPTLLVPLFMLLRLARMSAQEGCSMHAVPENHKAHVRCGSAAGPPLCCRSASRVGQSDSDINRKRIKAIRLELQKKGWKSVGF